VPSVAVLSGARASDALHVKAITKEYQPFNAYNVEVANDHTFFVGNSGAWVHNSCLSDLVPGINGFASWFNNLTAKEFARFWSDPAAQRAIKDRLRHPGEWHEWFMVSRADTLKEKFGLTAEEIWSMRTKIKDLKWIEPQSGLPGGHGEFGSTAFHNELGRALDESKTFAEARARLIELAQRWNIPNLPDLVRLQR
jgi:hypothetical protein